MTDKTRSPRISFYGRTYLDVEVQVPLASLSAGKSKVDARVTPVHGGFACNAARALGGRFAPDEVRVVTVTSWLDWPLLRASLPGRIALDAIVRSAGSPLPPISVIIDPAKACRILRDRSEHDAAEWQIERIPAGALSARLHVFGRLPSELAGAVLERGRSSKARFAWCGGDSLPRELERECDVLCVNSAEAGRLVGATDATPRQLALALAARARVRDAVRVVTGGGKAATAAAFRDGRSVAVREARPAPVAPARIKRLLGVGDAFAAHFLAGACFDARGAPRERLEVARALAAAQKAAGQFITRSRE
ncbi:MAG: PfkB family carbohydrate kinase [Myxococcaceae bacterium]